MTVQVTLAILGASGDLAHRLLMPGLGTLLDTNPEYEVTLVGCAVDELSHDEWVGRVREAMGGQCPNGRIEKVVATTRYEKLDLTNADALRKLLDGLGDSPVLYMALPPRITIQVCEALATIDLPAGLRLGLEKPFGRDLQSARDLNELVGRLVPENQIFRIDHFLGKSVVLNLLGLRFTNRIFERSWNNQNIQSVDIVVDEALALEDRARYYDSAGAMKDMIQSHLLLVLALFAMEEPPSLNERDVRDLIALMLRHTSLWDDDPTKSSRRARYLAGTTGGEKVPNYVDEPGVDPSKNTETLAEVTLRINTDRWVGVPFRLRSGKALGDARNGITVSFRPVDHVPEGFINVPSNVLSIGMKPANIKMGISTNAESNRFELNESVLATDLAESPLKPYGEILDSIFRGDPLLTVRGDVAEECWRIIEPVMQAWADNRVPMDEYTAGGAGPTRWNAPTATQVPTSEASEQEPTPDAPAQIHTSGPYRDNPQWLPADRSAKAAGIGNPPYLAALQVARHLAWRAPGETVSWYAGTNAKMMDHAARMGIEPGMMVHAAIATAVAAMTAAATTEYQKQYAAEMAAMVG